MDDPDEELDYNALVDEFDEERVALANYYLYRYKLLKLAPEVLELGDDDIFTFLIIEEEFSNKQAQEIVKMEQQRRSQHG